MQKSVPRGRGWEGLLDSCTGLEGVVLSRETQCPVLSVFSRRRSRKVNGTEPLLSNNSLIIHWLVPGYSPQRFSFSASHLC